MSIEPGIWEIAVLALLREAPMHPYQMQRLLKMRRKDEILALKRGSLYHAIGRLERADLIAVEGTARNGKRPERTTYRITPSGQATLGEALRRMVSVPRRESSEFMAAMSFLVHLPPEEALDRLEERGARLEGQIAGISEGLANASSFVDRVHLVESEYLLAMLTAEREWVRKLAGELRSGELVWNLEQIFSGVHEERERASGNGGAE